MDVERPHGWRGSGKPDRPPEELAAELLELRAVRDHEMRSRWDRSLPLDEELFDRWERARSLGFGDGTSVYEHAYVYGDVTVGENTWIGPMTVLDGSGGLEIGSWCSISCGVQLYTHSTVEWAVSGGAADYQRARTIIEDRTFIGPLSVVAMGVRIGAGSVVGAHAFVNRDVPPGSVVVGVPGRVIGRAELGRDGRVRRSYDSDPEAP